MNRICENFIEELTSGNRQPSQALSEHLAECQSCRESAEALGLLKASRKPLSGTEAAAIAATIKAVQNSKAGTAASENAVAKASLLKYLLLSAILLTGISALILYNQFTGNSSDAEKILQPGTDSRLVSEQEAAVSTTTAAELTTHEKSGEEPGYESENTPVSEESATNSATEVRIISPDEEEIAP